MGGKDSEASTGGLVLFRSTEGPEGDGASTKLSEPALQLRLRGVMRQTRHVQNLTPLRQECANIGTSIHRPSQNIWVILWRLRLAN